jgi:hypothetical protein
MWGRAEWDKCIEVRKVAHAHRKAAGNCVPEADGRLKCV